MNPMVSQASYREIPAKEWTHHLASPFRNHFEGAYVASVLVPHPLTVVAALELNRNRDAIGHVMYRRRVDGSVEIGMIASNVPQMGIGRRLINEVVAAERGARLFIAAALVGTEPFWESLGFAPCADRRLRQDMLPYECREDRARLTLYVWVPRGSGLPGRSA